MRRYETIYIANPNLDDGVLEEVVGKFSDLIEKQKGSIIKIDEWGKRKMAYEVQRFDKGHYVLLDFCGLPDMVAELERNLKLDDRILKYSTVKIDEDVDPAKLIVEEEKTEGETENQVEEKQVESAEEA